MSNEQINEDPFAPENIGVLQFIMLGRIYDVLMADLQIKKPEVAEMIAEAHSKGFLIGVPPIFNGQFLSGEDEDEESSEPTP